MEVILLENIMNLGNIGDKVIVKPGYGRNFLLKTGKALRYSKENQEHVTKKKDELNKKNIETKNKFKEISKLIHNKTFTFNMESKENGDLYASIKPKEISKIILEELKTEIGPSEIIIKKEINKIGQFEININLHRILNLVYLKSKFKNKMDSGFNMLGQFSEEPGYDFSSPQQYSSPTSPEDNFEGESPLFQ